MKLKTMRRIKRNVQRLSVPVKANSSAVRRIAQELLKQRYIIDALIQATDMEDRVKAILEEKAKEAAEAAKADAETKSSADK